MKKRVICIILSLCLAGAPFNAQVFAADIHSSENHGDHDNGSGSTESNSPIIFIPAPSDSSTITDNSGTDDTNTPGTTEPGNSENEGENSDSTNSGANNPDTPGGDSEIPGVEDSDIEGADTEDSELENPDAEDEQDEAVVITGWQKDKTGKVRYYDKDGKYSIGLKKINGKMYYFNSKGYVVTGLKTIKGKTYYFSKTGKAGAYGAAQKGWVTYKKNCYYFDKKKFTLKKNAFIDGYKVDKNGKSKTRYLILQIVNSKTNSKMSNDKKIQTLWKFLVTNKWKYIRTYEHARPNWVWYKGWTDDFANSLMTHKGGNCFRYAAVLGYLVKEATGYPVRIYHGSTPARRGGLTPHGWITVKINNNWYAYDPDLYKFGAHSSTYYKTLFSTTSRRIHRQGKYTEI